MTIEQWGFFSHTHCDTGLPFIMVISEDPWHSLLMPSVLQWSCHYLFLWLRSVVTWDRTPISSIWGERSTPTPTRQSLQICLLWQHRCVYSDNTELSAMTYGYDSSIMTSPNCLLWQHWMVYYDNTELSIMATLNCLLWQNWIFWYNITECLPWQHWIVYYMYHNSELSTMTTLISLF